MYLGPKAISIGNVQLVQFSKFNQFNMLYLFFNFQPALSKCCRLFASHLTPMSLAQAYVYVEEQTLWNKAMSDVRGWEECLGAMRITAIRIIYKVLCPSWLAKLVPTRQMSLWFMVLLTIVTGVYKPTNITGVSLSPSLSPPPSQSSPSHSF